ncbi:MAG TPA: hypothetical protein VKA83_11400 [Methylomirabilota bacterium]|nr:hypothetical protein [Methylomirabilota bacterium]
MPAVFVHGVPDTHRVWTALLSRLGRKDVVTLSLPGLGGPVPDGFDAIPGCSHWWQLERPAVVADELRRF